MKGDWIHPGIDKHILAKKYEEFKKIEFPAVPEEDEVYDLFSVLVELDGHIAGLVSSYLKNKSINLQLLDSDDEFNFLLKKMIDSKATEGILEYKKYLDELIKEIKLIEGLSTELTDS